jgi:D-alanine-D-alanine ligase
MAVGRIGVAMGGISPEHPVSLVSGLGMLASLDPGRYLGFPILISRENRWHWPKAGYDRKALATPEAAAALMAAPPADWHAVRFPDFPVFPRCDMLLLGLHGVGGEDGRLQGFLDLAGQPYTGSGSLGSALAMDKIASKHIYRSQGIPTGRFRVLEAREYPSARALLEGEFAYPMVLKHPQGGSSIGVGIARDPEALDGLVASLGAGVDHLLVEEFLPGREGTCGFLAGFPPLPPTEIRPLSDSFFNYEAKYQPGRTEEITPAPFPPEVIAEMQSLAARCHAALRLAVYSRTDFIWSGDRLAVLETNSLPGFTPTSLLPQAASHAGLSYRDLITKIIEESGRKPLDRPFAAVGSRIPRDEGS